MSAKLLVETAGLNSHCCHLLKTLSMSQLKYLLANTMEMSEQFSEKSQGRKLHGIFNNTLVGTEAKSDMGVGTLLGVGT